MITNERMTTSAVFLILFIPCIFLLLLLYLHLLLIPTPTSIIPKKSKKINTLRKLDLSISFQSSIGIRVFIGFNFKPMLSGDRSSGEIQIGLKVLLGLRFNFGGLYIPYTLRKYSIGISMAWGCSSVTIDPHAWTSTKALYLLSSFEVMWRASEWKGEFSPTNIRDRHCSFPNPSLMSRLPLIAWRNRQTFKLCLSSSNLLQEWTISDSGTWALPRTSLLKYRFSNNSFTTPHMP